MDSDGWLAGFMQSSSHTFVCTEIDTMTLAVVVVVVVVALDGQNSLVTVALYAACRIRY